MEQVYCILDYETRSEADLKKVGAFEYSVHKSTQVLCAAWRVGTKEELLNAPVKVWSPALPKDQCDDVTELLDALEDEDVILVAHNSLFEQVITKNVLARMLGSPKSGLEVFWPPLAPIPISRWVCTAAMARAMALPGGLEGACEALKLPVKKDMDGRRLILKYCKPRKPTKNNLSRWHKAARDLRRIMLYCQNDVIAETHLFLAIPLLNPMERRVWELDQTINSRGFMVDRQLVRTVLGMIEEEIRNLDDETAAITNSRLKSTRQGNELITLITEQWAGRGPWPGQGGVILDDLKKKTVEDALKSPDIEVSNPNVKRLLEIRQAVSKSSTSKYVAFEQRSRSDSVVRDILIYHTASTGRWGGTGVQPQNFPRGTIKNTIRAADVLSVGDLELVRMIYGDPMTAFSSCLRSMIVARPGTKIFCADYAAIEARVLAWMANHHEMVKAFSEGRLVYEEMASKIFGVEVKNVTKDQRFVGKGVILGCGYSMGPPKFQATCELQGQPITLDLAKVAVKVFRDENEPIVAMWKKVEQAAIAAVSNKGKAYKICGTKWFVYKQFLFCELPSGRRLSYFGPEIRFTETPWGEKKPTLYHWGVDSKSKKWKFDKTYGGRLVENVVQGTSRDIMAEAMLRIESAGYRLILSVHDELLGESENGNEEEFERLMSTLPTWAAGCPVNVEGWSGTRYRKG